VVVELWHLLLKEPKEHVEGHPQARHASQVELAHSVLLGVEDLEHDAEGLLLVDVEQEDGHHVAHALHVPYFGFDQAEALEDSEEVFLAVVESFLEVDVIGQSSRGILMDFDQGLLFALLLHEVLHEATNLALLLLGRSVELFVAVPLDLLALFSRLDRHGISQ